ncbi:MAG: glycosyltransferase, partial [Candidatus Sungbacteria bacterium]|nr:glycosyltransferase [Candidatus Sungbacteria bacterium]
MTSRAAAEFVVLLPAYNEEKRIGRLVREIRNFVSRVVVVDDGSFHATALRAKEAGADVLRREQNGGKGEALRDGIEYVLKNYDCEAILLMDADGQHKAEDINKFLEFWKTKKPDFIIGVRDFSPEKMPFLRRVWNAAISRIVSALTGTRLRDSQCGFRLLSRRAAEKIKLKRRGYFTETEMIFEAAAGGFKAEEVPVETVYFPDNGRLNFFAALKRSFIILFFTAGKAFTTERVTLLLRWSAALLLLVFSYQALDKIDSPFLGKQENFAQELRAATDWLKSNSEPDAVVMAHWFRGHQLVAFADRRVVSTTKVYPSEAAEVAGRYRDIAGFFLTEDEEEARQIALRYRASYIFLDRDFQGWLCKAINRCEVTTNNRSSLNRRGILNTVAGRMTQGGDFKHFKKVWDSPRFLIYEVTDQPQEFSASEKEVILALARETLTRFVRDGQKVDAEFFRPYLEERGLWEKFSEHRDTDVTVWIDGALRASRISSGNTLTENLVKAAADAADDRRFAPIMKDELPKMRIEAIVFKDDRAPLT